MRRLSALLLTMFLLVPAAQAEEIAFRGIPWGISVLEVQKHIQEQFDMSAEMFLDPQKNCLPYSAAMAEEYLTPQTEHKCGYANMQFARNQSVAGYKLYSIEWHAFFGETQDGISLECADSEFYFAEYSLKADDIEIAYADLQGKLSYLYGECTTTKEQDTYTDKYTCTSTWHGDNNTAVTLFAKYTTHKDKDKSGKVYLRYYKTDCDEKLQSIDKAVKQMELVEQYKNSDLSGL